MTTDFNQVRNFGLVGHSSSGKTSLAEAILYNTKAINRLGKITDGTTAMDYEPEEINRQITLNTSFYPFTYNNQKFNIIDTPGENDFLSDTKISLQAAEKAVFVIDAVGGVKVGTEKVWGFAEEYNLPKVIFINMIDRERADFFKVLDEIETTFSLKATPLYLPIGSEENFTGLLDLIKRKAYIYNRDGQGSFEKQEMPTDMAGLIKKWREKMLENIVEADDQVMEKYLDGQELSTQEIEDTLLAGIKSGLVAPVIPGSATLNIGVIQLLDLINLAMPFPAERNKITGRRTDSEESIKFAATEQAPFSALIFKTIADPFTGKINIFKVKSGKVSSDATIFNSTKKINEKLGQLLKIEGKKQTPIAAAVAGDIAAVAKLKATTTGDTFCLEDNQIIFTSAAPLSPSISFAVEAIDNEDKVFSSLAKLAEEDPTLKIDRDQSTSEVIISGTGQLHLENIKEKLKRKYGVDINLNTPKIPYRETVKTAKENIEYKHKKQSGGRGQFAVVNFDIFPLARGENYIFDEALSGTNVPRNFVPAVEKGVAEAMQQGILAGYPVVDLKIRFFDGRSHDVDSSEMAFKTAAAHCFTQAMREATPILLEPIMNMEIVVPEDAVGDVMGDLNGRRGRVLGTDSKGKFQIIKAEVPMAEVLKYSYDLTSLTGGRGSFIMKQTHYEEVPSHLADKIIAAAKEEKEEKK